MFNKELIQKKLDEINEMDYTDINALTAALFIFEYMEMNLIDNHYLQQLFDGVDKIDIAIAVLSRIDYYNYKDNTIWCIIEEEIEKRKKVSD